VSAKISAAPLVLIAASACIPSGSRTGELPASALAFLVDAPPLYASADAGPSPKPEAQGLQERFEAALRPEVRGRMHHDPALDRAAAAYAETHTETKQGPTRALGYWILYKSGAASLDPEYRVRRGTRGSVTLFDLPHFDQHAVDYAGKLDASSHRAYGIARFAQGGTISQGIVVTSAPLDVKPFPKAYAPGAPFTLEVRPRDPYTNLTFFADDEDGSVHDEAMVARPDGTFSVSWRTPSRPSRYFVEIRATEPRAMAPDPEHPSQHTVLLCPIYVGVPEPAAPAPSGRSPSSVPSDPAAWSAWIRSIYDAERAKWRKAPLLSDPRLTALAEARAAVIARIPGEAAPERGLRRKLAEMGIPVRTHRWDTSRFDAVDDYVVMHLLSPARRKHLILPDRAMYAIGIAADPPGEGDRPQYSVAEYIVFP
jgi:hypothetical protein